ncbi:GtrA family protein [Mucilaginibacter hurinus]|uniref:GtrA family protein n=1 Tax=Mucilaginibacter hurinus TaxID=2201324 RepID=A0A367GP37_9SPHI|nr:GtrA family protein [Mucilaginibacter hurinus]RCH55219.1 GtrA family protein [Mucilaginibacter hurinus]
MMNTWHTLMQSRIFRFLLSAGAGFFVDVSSFYVCFNYIFTKRQYPIIGINVGNHTLSLTVSFSLGVIVNFLITRYIVFSESKLSPRTQFLRFASIAVVGLFASMLIMDLFVKPLNVYAPLARILTALSLFFASYFIHKVFTFGLSSKKK